MHKKNAKRCRELLREALAAMRATDSRFPFKQDVADLIGAASYLIGSEVGPLTEDSQTETLLMAHTLLQGVCARRGLELRQIAPAPSEPLEVNIYYTVSARHTALVKRTIDVPHGIPPERYCRAVLGVAPNFAGCEVLNTVSSKEINGVPG